MLAAAGLDFENVGLASAEEFQALRNSGKLLFNQLPLLEIDGLNVTQSVALVQHIARRAGLYGNTPADATKCDMIHGLCKDLAGPPMGRCFKEDQSAAVQGMTITLNKFAPFLENCFDSEFLVGNSLTFADVLAAEALTSYLECIDGALDPYPKLKALQERVVALPGLKKYLSSDQRYSKPDDAYVINVAKVLQRALPPHFPDNQRFVK